MSVIMLRPERLFQIANFLYELNTFGFDRFGFSCPYELATYVFKQTNNVSKRGADYRVSDFYKTLVEGNKVAYSYSYDVFVNDEEYFNIDLNFFKPIIKPRVADVNGEYPQDWHYEMSNLIGTYLYQVADLPKNTSPAFIQLVDVLKVVKTILNNFIVENTGNIKQKNASMVDMTVENILHKLCDESNVVIQNSSYEELARYDGRESIDTKYNTKKVLSMHVEMVEQLYRPSSFIPALCIEVED